MTEVANYARALLAAWGVSRFGDSGGRLDTLKGMTAFLLFGVVLAPCAGAFIGAGAVALHGGGYLVSLRPWLLSNVLTGLTLLPVLLIVRARLVAKLGWVPLHRWREAGILLIALLGVGGLVLLDSNASGASLYAPLPLLLWAAVRFGPGGTSAAVLTVAILAITGTLGSADRSSCNRPRTACCSCSCSCSWFRCRCCCCRRCCRSSAAPRMSCAPVSSSIGRSSRTRPS